MHDMLKSHRQNVSGRLYTTTTSVFHFLPCLHTKSNPSAKHTPAIPLKYRRDIHILIPGIVELLAIPSFAVSDRRMQVQLAVSHVGDAEAFMGVRSGLALLIAVPGFKVGRPYAVAVEDLRELGFN
jgi:hypothetical protein